jgi:PleD family two-component response regulator
MRSGIEDARVLVASDSVDDAAQVVAQLQSQHREVRASTRADDAEADFDEFKPDVLVLAFDSIERAEGYSLRLYRRSSFVRLHRYRTVLLCTKEQLRASFELCKKGIFDDYVLHWPLAQDGLRLTMSVWAAARDIFMYENGGHARDGVVHSQQLGALDALIGQQRLEGDRRAASGAQALVEAESHVGAAIDAFSRRMAEKQSPAVIDVKDAAAWSRELERLKQEGVARAFGQTAQRQAPIAAWPANVQEQLATPIAEMRASIQRARARSVVILAIEDDEFARKLIANALSDQGCVLLFAEDAAKAFGILRRLRPSLILMDINLPDIDGVTLLRQLKAVQHLVDIPVLMLTGAARREAVANSMDAGAAGFIVKPFTREALVSNVQKMLHADL